MPVASHLDGRIEYFVEGNGPPLLLLHGAGSDASLWFHHGYVEELAREFTVITPNNRGYGGSSPVATPDHLRFELYRDDLRAVLDDADVERALVMGYSRGGVLATLLAMEYPERIAGLVVGGGNLARNHRSRPSGRNRFGLPDPRRIDSPGQVTAAVGRRVREYILGPPPRSPSRWNLILERLDVPRHEVWQRYVAPLADADRAAERLTMPALFFQGERDGAVDLRETRSLVARLPNGEFHMVPGATHALITEPDRVLPLVVPFLRRTASADLDFDEDASRALASAVSPPNLGAARL